MARNTVEFTYRKNLAAKVREFNIGLHLVVDQIALLTYMQKIRSCSLHTHKSDISLFFLRQSAISKLHLLANVVISWALENLAHLPCLRVF